MKDASSVAKDGLSVMKDASSVAEDALSFEKDALLVKEDALSEAKDTSSFEKDASFVRQDASSKPDNGLSKGLKTVSKPQKVLYFRYLGRFTVKLHVSGPDWLFLNTHPPNPDYPTSWTASLPDCSS